MGNENELVGPSQYPVYQSGIRNITVLRPISIRLKKYDYFKGEFVEGLVVLQNVNSLVLNDIYLNLFLTENWKINDDDNPKQN